MDSLQYKCTVCGEMEDAKDTDVISERGKRCMVCFLLDSQPGDEIEYKRGKSPKKDSTPKTKTFNNKCNKEKRKKYPKRVQKASLEQENRNYVIVGEVEHQHKKKSTIRLEDFEVDETEANEFTNSMLGDV